MTEDDLHVLEEQAQKVTDASIKNVEKIQSVKEKEILDV